MRLHILGLPHTVTSDEFSHCAFTGKVLKFPSMMRSLGDEYEILHYGVEGAEVECGHINVMSREEQDLLRNRRVDQKDFVGDDADIGSPLFKMFNTRLREKLIKNVGPNDIILLPFGWGHADAVKGLPFTLVESGIGYPDLYPGAHFRIFESNAWMHWHQGREKRNGKNYEWVIPNYFDTEAWKTNLEPSNEVVYFGRICKIKGLDTVVEVARKRPDLHFVICGQGDPTPWLVERNIEYRPPLVGRDRSDLLGNALAVLMPTEFTEPFGGVAVEAMLCGTPVLSTTFGAFTETIEDEVTGFRCHTLGDYLAGLERIEGHELNRSYISTRARLMYGYERIAKMYDRAFKMIEDLRGRGWYSTRSSFGPVVKTQNENAWTVAQKHELTFHMDQRFRANEQRKRLQYAGFMGIDAEATRGKRILDIGCGPESLMLSYEVQKGSVGLDPLRFTDTDEQRYESAEITRWIRPAEEGLGEEQFDEIWIYNCLQHVQDVHRILENMKGHASVIRMFEWMDVQTDVMHLHVLTPERIKEVLGEPHQEMIGTWRQGSFPVDKFFAAVWQ